MITRDFYRPSKRGGIKLELPKGLTAQDCEVWYYNNNNKFVAMGFKGTRQVKPAFHYSFPNTQKRDDYILRFYLEINKAKNATKEKKLFINQFKKDDILLASWGYDQTNVDFYKVLEVKGMNITVIEIGQKDVGPAGYDCTYVAPNPAKTTGAKMVKRVCYPGNIIRIGNTSPHRFEGKKTYKSWYA
jgi:hypothetical protein